MDNNSSLIIVLYGKGHNKEVAKCYFNGNIDDAYVYAEEYMEKFPNSMYYEIYTQKQYELLTM